MNKENVYEGLFILNSEAYARNPEEVSGAIPKTIESLGGVVRVSRLWDERKFAYPIKNHRRGVYWLAYFRIATDKVADLNRQFRLNGNVIRFLVTNLDPRLEETLVQHALSGSVEEPEEAAEGAQTVYEEDQAVEEPAAE